jgi:hypothetical protein
LIYETSVSQIRQRPPLVTSVRLLQAVSAATGMAAIVASTVITVEQGSVWVTIAYVAVTGAAALSAAWSHRDMLRSGDVADRILLDAVADESISNHQ